MSTNLPTPVEKIKVLIVDDHAIIRQGLRTFLELQEDADWLPIEAIVRGLRVRELWDEMKENARLATNSQDGGARISANIIAEMVEHNPDVEIHMACHSAGSIFLAPLVSYITKVMGKKITSCTLWAPGITISEFRSTYMPAIQDKSIERFSLYTLKDKEENDDHCANIYHKSLLYLVSNALEPTYQEKILGME